MSAATRSPAVDKNSHILFGDFTLEETEKLLGEGTLSKNNLAINKAFCSK